MLYRDAWYAQRGLSRTEAKRRYVTTLIETMHRYASQTPEALELVGELEFVWDQVRANTVPSRSASSSSAHQSVGVPPFPSNNKKRTKKSSRSSRDSNDQTGRLRVLSPVSQPEAEYQRSLQGLRTRNGRGSDDIEEDEEEEQQQEDDDEDDDNLDEFQDAEEEEYNDAEEKEQGEDYASDEKNISDNNNNNNSSSGSGSSEAVAKPKQRRKRKTGGARDRGGVSIIHHHHNNNGNSSTARDQVPRLWRRRVEQALTNMTAEVAAVREQMETRAVSQRRRSGLWAWLKWLLWVTLRQILWDVAMLSVLLIWMRARGDRRVEDRLLTGWAQVKNKLVRLGVFRKLALPG